MFLHKEIYCTAFRLLLKLFKKLSAGPRRRVIVYRAHANQDLGCDELGRIGSDDHALHFTIENNIVICDISSVDKNKYK